ncbi:MAG: PAS domain S-box protein [Methanomassiliicoccales archaeon]
MNVSELKVLSVDDEPELVLLSKEILESFHDMKVWTATSAKEALGMIGEMHFDAIISDYQMPVMDGIKFLKALRSEKDGTPFILFTGRGREEVVVEAIDSGADGYVQKGTDVRSAFAELAHKVRTSVVRYRAEIAMEESEARYRSMIDGSPMGIFLADTKGGCTYGNPAWLEMTGLGQDDVAGLGWMEAVHPDDRLKVQTFWNGSILFRNHATMEYRLLRGREVCWAHMYLAPVNVAGGMSGFLSTNNDITKMKRAEQEAREKERAISRASSLANVGYWVWKASGKEMLLSDGLSKMLGIGPGSSLPHDAFFDMVHIDDRVMVIETLNKAMIGEGETVIEHRMIRPDGAELVVRDVVEATLSNGRPDHVMGMVQDITGTKKADQRFRELESLYEAIIDTMAEGIIVRDPLGHIKYSNPQARQMLGDYLPIIDGSQRASSTNLIKLDGTPLRWEDLPTLISMRTRSPVAASVFGLQEGDRKRWFSVNARPLFSGEEIESVVASFSEVTDLVSSTEKLIESKQLYEIIVNNMVDIINVTDLNVRFKYISPSVEKLRGFTVEEVMNHRLEDIFTPDSLELARSVLAEEMALEQRGGGDPDRSRYLELEEYRKDGSTVWVGNAIRFTRDESGKATGFIIQARDITESRTSIAALHEAHSKLATMTRLTRHDIRNQLQVASGWMQMLKVDGARDMEMKRKAEKAIANADQLIELSSQYEMLGTKTPYHMELRAEVDRVVENLGAGDLRLENQLGGELVLADPLMHKVIYNLVENAVRHGGKATYVRFRSEKDGGKLRIICEDDGNGVPVEDKERIFIRGVGQNTGDGLFFARTILSITGMSIREDGVPGKGARFVIEVPEDNWR